jgi:hypothetical protein
MTYRSQRRGGSQSPNLPGHKSLALSDRLLAAHQSEKWESGVVLVCQFFIIRMGIRQGEGPANSDQIVTRPSPEERPTRFGRMPMLKQLGILSCHILAEVLSELSHCHLAVRLRRH